MKKEDKKKSNLCFFIHAFAWLHYSKEHLKQSVVKPIIVMEPGHDILPLYLHPKQELKKHSVDYLNLCKVFLKASKKHFRDIYNQALLKPISKKVLKSFFYITCLKPF